MRKTYDEQLEMLHVDLIQMGALCERAIGAAARTLTDDNEALRKDVEKLERDIDQKERDIEDLCIKMILRQQPVASDLRLISAAMRMISDMERIGDQASDIVDITRHLKNRKVLESLPLKDMEEVTMKMVTESVDSFVRQDVELAKKVMEEDDIVDAKFIQTKDQVAQMLMNNIQLSEEFVDIIMIAKYYERIGDHAVNIAEWVEYSITGERVGDAE
ncbi:MAG TPA: phosphate signaling complex protein PhoU [Candidatus Eubacterium avistercoris]|uniref:Phosphate-specific transport system accessory protein PhoU n=1 Tax=Candidatus Eubacterium avistercoris TaxID=2838567 RepID=A0A9D2IGV2_9FIRM|nr:phosphate signaling complex protein PhoU [Candidatus Eubacterium avistercoris]